MNKTELKEKSTKRHIARLLTVLEAMGVTNDIKVAVKSEIWDLHNDLIAIDESKESIEGEKEWTEDT